MFSNGISFGKAAGCIWLFIAGYFSSSIFATENELNESVEFLKVVPSKCVALRKGRECFATIKVKWKSKGQNKYCLRRQSDQLEINCWHNHDEGDFSYVFSSNENERLELVRTFDQKVIGTSTIKVSWVYNSKKRRTRWRVF